jgi:Tfp pilus assembly PilM family ATPase
MRWLTKSISPIGVDVGTRCIHAAQLSAVFGKRRLLAGVSVPRRREGMPDVDEWFALRDLFDRQGFIGDDIVLHAPPDALRMEIVEVPPRSSGAPVDQLARGELARAAKLDGQAFECAAWDLPDPARASATMSMLAAGMPEDEANALLDPCELADLRVLAIDTRAWAMTRAFDTRHQPGKITAIADLGWQDASLILVAGDRPVYQRSLRDAATSLLHRAVAAECNLQADETDYLLSAHGPLSLAHGGQLPQYVRTRRLIARHVHALIAEMETALGYAAHRYPQWPIVSVLLTGGGALVPGLASSLGEQIAHTAVVTAADMVDISKWNDGDAGTALLATAIGLAQHGGDGQ